MTGWRRLAIAALAAAAWIATPRAARGADVEERAIEAEAGDAGSATPTATPTPTSTPTSTSTSTPTPAATETPTPAPTAAAAPAGTAEAAPALPTDVPIRLPEELPNLGVTAPASVARGGTRHATSFPSGPHATLAAPEFPSSISRQPETAQALRIVLGLTVLAILPALLVSLTSFLRIIIVLSMLRHAIGMNETPPNTVLIGLALFLTMFTMSPVLDQVNREALQPFMANKVSMEASYEKGMAPLREFMIRQTREQDLALMVELSRAKPPETIADVGNAQLVPAYMLSELRAAFQIGFVVFLPFLLIDLAVSSVLMSLGMMMMPPTTVSLPLKILMFVLIDGWSLLLKALVGSFH